MSRLDLALEHLLKAVMAPCDDPDDCSAREALLATGDGAIHEQLNGCGLLCENQWSQS